MNIEKYEYRLLELPPERGLEIDLGCGDGRFTEALAKLNPDKTILAVDMLNGRLEKCRKKALLSGLNNIIVLKSDTLFFLHIMLPDNSADAIHLLCPDPWPKSKHRSHRILSSEFSGLVCRKLEKGGIFHFSSDHLPYFESAQRIFKGNPAFREISLPDKLLPLKTDFEIQWLSEGKEVKHICWKKI